jgi:hypothetical protein
MFDEMGFLPATPYNKINIHVGGTYGDKEAALERFSKVCVCGGGGGGSTIVLGRHACADRLGFVDVQQCVHWSALGSGGST